MEISPHVSAQHSESQTSSTSAVTCRICYEGNLTELCKPCQCTGTMGLVHRKCIEHWISIMNLRKCEICHYRYRMERRPRSAWEWFKKPTKKADRRNFFMDLTCFFLITPLTIASAYLCITGATRYDEFVSDTQWESGGLIALASFLCCIYFFWCALLLTSLFICGAIQIAVRYHVRIFKQWRRHSMHVHLLEVSVDKPDATKSCNSEYSICIEEDPCLDLTPNFTAPFNSISASDVNNNNAVVTSPTADGPEELNVSNLEQLWTMRTHL